MSTAPASVATLQFQTSHGQRQWPVVATSLPVIGLQALFGGMSFDGGLTWSFVAMVVLVVVTTLAVFGARRQRYGLFVSGVSVRIAGPLGSGNLAPMTPDRRPALSMARRRDVDRIRVVDSFGNDALLPWLVHVSNRSAWQRTAYGLSNRLLVREPFSPDREARRWRPTPVTWGEDNGAEVVAYLTAEIARAFEVDAVSQQLG